MMSGSTNGRGPSLYPVLGYRDAEAAIAFLKEAFGFEEWMVVPRPEGGVMHAELAFGNGVLMLHSIREDQAAPAPDSHSLYLVVEDIDGHFQRAKAAGAEITKEPFDTDYGSRDFSARDLEGYLWNFGSYCPSRPASS
jgi:uncharacterized glyoxalase superfamily protein PhnB